MSPAKQELLEWVGSLPDECSWEDLQYFLDLRQSVAEGLEDVQEGRLVPHEEAKRRMREWLKSYGPKQP
jgi:predicted transcriptional regulator